MRPVLAPDRLPHEQDSHEGPREAAKFLLPNSFGDEINRELVTALVVDRSRDAAPAGG